MSVIISNHVMGDATAVTHHHLMYAFGSLLNDKIIWYNAAEDLRRAVLLFDSDISLKHLPPEVEELVSSQLIWQSVRHAASAVLVINGHGQLPALRLLTGLGTRTYLWAVDDPHEFSASSKISPFCTRTFTTEPLAVVEHPRCSFLPHAVLQKDVDETLSMVQYSRFPAPDILVVGSPYMRRVEWLNAMVPFLENRGYDIRFLTHRNHENFNKLHPFWKAKSAAPVSWSETLMLYARSKCVLNIHREHNDSPIASSLRLKEAQGLNQTCYSVPAVGGRLLCDSSRLGGMAEQFSSMVSQFASPEGMATYACLLVEGDHSVAEQARENTEHAQQTIAERHTWERHRIPQLLAEFEEDGVDLG